MEEANHEIRETHERMASIMFRKSVWRGVAAIVGATAVSCLYCAGGSLETTLLGLLVGPLVAVSVVLFLVVERTFSARWPKYVAFFLPSVLFAGLCLYQISSLRSSAAEQGGISEGGEDVIAYFAQSYSVGLCFAFGSCCGRAGVSGRTLARRRRLPASDTSL